MIEWKPQNPFNALEPVPFLLNSCTLRTPDILKASTYIIMLTLLCILVTNAALKYLLIYQYHYQTGLYRVDVARRSSAIYYKSCLQHLQRSIRCVIHVFGPLFGLWKVRAMLLRCHKHFNVRIQVRFWEFSRLPIRHSSWPLSLVFFPGPAWWAEISS